MLANIANKANIPKFEKEYKLINTSFNANFFKDDLKSLAKSIDIEYIGLKRIFRREYEKGGIPFHWDHWNYEGHKLVANTLTNRLKKILKK
ncbi:MAG: hypothetical protein ACTSRG_25030 [Candidatus Helarchaeota archaeon]